MKKTLVFGASLNPGRYSNRVIKRLVDHKVETEAFGLKTGNIEGVEIHNSLDHFSEIHTISLYLNPSRQEQYYQDLIALRPKRIIFNPGTENPAFYQMLKDQDIEVEEACTLVLLATRQY